MTLPEPVPERPAFRRIVWPIALAETIVWAAIYYLFPALLPAWESDLGWSKTVLSGGFTLALLASGLFSPFAGRLIDRGHGRAVLAGGAAFAAILLLLLSQATTVWQFYLLWFGLGIAMAGSLYQPCFALLTHAFGDRARRAITLVTLVAGFAGTLSFPGAHALIAIGGWRFAAIAFAASVALVAVPLFWHSAGLAARIARDVAPEAGLRVRDAASVAGRALFWLIAISFALVALDHGIVTTHILPILADRGVNEEAAVLAAAMIGPMQVAGRLAMMAAEPHVSTRGIAIGCNAAIAVAALFLLAAGAAPALVVGFVVLMGAGIGINSIIRPLVVAELLGRRNFGLVSGLLAIPTTFGYALAPTLAAVIWAAGGYDQVILAAFAMATIGLGFLVLAWRAATRPTR